VRSDQARRHRDAAVVLLAVNSGFTDAVGFIALGGSFTSVMTGNMVLIGLSAATGNGTLAASCGIALVAFVAGCVVGARVAGSHVSDDPVWPPAVSRALLIQLGLAVVFAAGWWACGGHPDGDWRRVWLAVNALALGTQSSAVQRFGVPGLSTTYLTGTLTQLTIRLTSSRSVRSIGLSGALLAGLIGGAALAAALLRSAPDLIPAVQILLLLVAVTRPWRKRRAAADARAEVVTAETPLAEQVAESTP
jgi:uncharacterized membrane protein YoaK (UPF0700 family)